MLMLPTIDHTTNAFLLKSDATQDKKMEKHRKNNTNSQNSISQSVLDTIHHDILVQMPVSTMLPK